MRPANSQLFVIAHGQFTPDAEQFWSVPMTFIKVDLCSPEDVERLPRPAGGRRASREFCLHEPIENAVVRRRQLFQTGVELRRRRFSCAASCAAEGLHSEA